MLMVSAFVSAPKMATPTMHNSKNMGLALTITELHEDHFWEVLVRGMVCLAGSKKPRLSLQPCPTSRTPAPRTPKDAPKQARTRSTLPAK